MLGTTHREPYCSRFVNTLRVVLNLFVGEIKMKTTNHDAGLKSRKALLLKEDFLHGSHQFATDYQSR
jgi:hypothetical protein